jgi:hypothetical protein
MLHEEKRRTGSDSGRTNATKTVSDVFRHQSGTGKLYCRTRFDVGLEMVNITLFIFFRLTHSLGVSTVIRYRAVFCPILAVNHILMRIYSINMAYLSMCRTFSEINAKLTSCSVICVIRNGRYIFVCNE